MSDKKYGADLDAFWDIGRLVPPKPKQKNTVPPRISPKRTEAVSVTVEQTEASAEETVKKDGKLTFSKETKDEAPKATPIYASYENFSPLIQKVEIVNWKSTYNYYEFFCRQAAALYHTRGKECEEAHFFSYVAQYSQLNRRQLDWYLWWRECVRKGIYMSVDVSYIYLLIFEIINLGDAVDTKTSLDTLIALWKNYKDIYPQLTGVLGDWICDYSLIHNLPIHFPDTRINREMISSVFLAEALLSFDISDITLLSKLMISFCNAYNYRKSKFYTEENREAYDKHLPAALEYFLSRIDVAHLLAKQPKKHHSIVSFTGALCSYKTRKHIEVDYISLCDSHELKSKIGEIVKYAENKLRSHLGIRSRLTVTLKDEKIRSCIDEYFALTLSLRRDGDSLAPEYEKLYDVKDTAFSLTSALDIEKQSWEVTEKLVEAFEEDTKAEPTITLPEPNEAPAPSDEVSEKELFLSKIANHRPFFDAILQNDAASMKAYVTQQRVMAEAVVDEINEKAADILGDILIEETDLGYQILEDYRILFQ